jgi:hypothetical protein
MPWLVIIFSSLVCVVTWDVLQALIGGGSSPGSPSLPVSSTPQPLLVTLSALATQTVAASAGTPFVVSLPPGGSWSSQSLGGITYTGVVPGPTGFSAWSGSSDAGTSAPVMGLYAGGGAKLQAFWVDPQGVSRQTTVTFAG